MDIDKNGARIILGDGQEYDCDIIADSMGDKSIDITRLRAETGYITYDPGFVNTGSCMSSICYINGEKRQDSNTRYMIFGVAEVISELSQGMTLKAGTIIAMGTPAGVGMGFEPPKYLAEGDLVRCEIDGIGALENRVKK